MAYKMSQEFPTASLDITESVCVPATSPLQMGRGMNGGRGVGGGGVSSNQTASFEEIMHIANSGSVGES